MLPGKGGRGFQLTGGFPACVRLRNALTLTVLTFSVKSGLCFGHAEMIHTMLQIEWEVHSLGKLSPWEPELFFL